MKQVFDKIEQKAKVQNRNRYITGVNAVQTQEDIRELLEAIMETVQEIENRVKQLEVK